MRDDQLVVVSLMCCVGFSSQGPNTNLQYTFFLALVGFHGLRHDRGGRVAVGDVRRRVRYHPRRGTACQTQHRRCSDNHQDHEGLDDFDY